MLWNNLGTSQLKRSQNIFHQVLVSFENSNLALSIWVRGWGNVALERAREREPPAGLGQGMLNLVR